MAIPDLSALLPAVPLLTGGMGPVTFRTSITPPVTVDPFAPASEVPQGTEEGWGGTLVRLLKPMVEMKLRDGRTVVYAPAGVPTENHLPLLGAGIGLGLLAIFGLGGLVGNVLGKRVTLGALGAGVLVLGAVARSGEST